MTIKYGVVANFSNAKGWILWKVSYDYKFGSNNTDQEAGYPLSPFQQGMIETYSKYWAAECQDTTVTDNFFTFDTNKALCCADHHYNCDTCCICRYQYDFDFINGPPVAGSKYLIPTCTSFDALKAMHSAGNKASNYDGQTVMCTYNTYPVNGEDFHYNLYIITDPNTVQVTNETGTDIQLVSSGVCTTLPDSYINSLNTTQDVQKKPGVTYSTGASTQCPDAYTTTFVYDPLAGGVSSDPLKVPNGTSAFSLSNDTGVVLNGKTYSLPIPTTMCSMYPLQVAKSCPPTPPKYPLVPEQYVLIWGEDNFRSSAYFVYHQVTIYNAIKVVNSTGLTVTLNNTYTISPEGTWLNMNDLGTAFTVTYPSGAKSDNLKLVLGSDGASYSSQFLNPDDPTDTLWTNRFYVTGIAMLTKGGTLTITMPQFTIVNATPRIMTVTKQTGNVPTQTLAPNGGFTAIATADLSLIDMQFSSDKGATFSSSYALNLNENTGSGNLEFSGTAAPGVLENLRYQYATMLSGVAGPIVVGKDTSVLADIITITMPVVTIVNSTDMVMWAQNTPLIPVTGQINYVPISVVDIPVTTVYITRFAPSASDMENFGNTTAPPASTPCLTYVFPPVVAETYYASFSPIGNPYVPCVPTETVHAVRTMSSLVQVEEVVRNTLLSPPSYLIYKDGAGGTIPNLTSSTITAAQARDSVDPKYLPTYDRYNSRYLCNGASSQSDPPVMNAFSTNGGGVVFITLPTVTIQNDTLTDMSVSGVDGIAAPVLLPAPTQSNIFSTPVPVADLPFVRLKFNTAGPGQPSNIAQPATGDGQNVNTWMVVDQPSLTDVKDELKTAPVKNFMFSSNFSDTVTASPLMPVDCSSCVICPDQDCCVANATDYQSLPAVCKSTTASFCETLSCPLATPNTKQTSSCTHVRPTAQFNTSSPCTGCISCGDFRYPCNYKPTPPLLLKLGGTPGQKASEFCITEEGTVNPYFSDVRPSIQGAIAAGVSIDTVLGYGVLPVSVTPSGKMATLVQGNAAGAALCQTYTETTLVGDINLPNTPNATQTCVSYYGTFDQQQGKAVGVINVNPVPVGVITVYEPIVKLYNNAGQTIKLLGIFNTSGPITLTNGQSYNISITDYANNQAWSIELADGTLMTPPFASNPDRFLTTQNNNTASVLINRFTLDPALTPDTITDPNAGTVTVRLNDVLGACTTSATVSLLENSTQASDNNSNVSSVIINVMFGSTTNARPLQPSSSVNTSLSTIPFCDSSGNTLSTPYNSFVAPVPQITFTVGQETTVYTVTGADQDFLCGNQNVSTATWVYYCKPFVNSGSFIIWQVTRAWNLGVGTMIITNNLNPQYEIYGQVFNPSGNFGSSVESGGVEAASLPPCVKFKPKDVTSFTVKPLDVAVTPGESAISGKPGSQCSIVGSVSSLPKNSTSKTVPGEPTDTWCGSTSFTNVNRNAMIVLSVKNIQVTPSSLGGVQQQLTDVDSTQMCTAYFPSPLPTVTPQFLQQTSMLNGSVPVYLRTTDYKTFTIDAPQPVGQMEPVFPTTASNQLLLYNTLVGNVTWTLFPLNKSSSLPTASGTVAPYDMTQGLLTFSSSATQADPYVLAVTTTNNKPYTLSVLVGVGFSSDGGAPCTSVSTTGASIGTICSLIPVNSTTNPGNISLVKDQKATSLIYTIAAPSPIGTSAANFPADGYSLSLTNDNTFPITVTKKQAQNEYVYYNEDPNSSKLSVTVNPKSTIPLLIVYADTQLVITDDKGYIQNVISTRLEDLSVNASQWNTANAPYFEGQVISASATNPVLAVTVPNVGTVITFTTVTSTNANPNDPSNTKCDTLTDETFISTPFNNQTLDLLRNSKDPSRQQGTMTFYGDLTAQNVTFKQNGQLKTIRVSDLTKKADSVADIPWNGRVEVTNVDATGKNITVTLNCVWNVTITLQEPCTDTTFSATVAVQTPINTIPAVTLTTSNPSTVLTLVDPRDIITIVTYYGGKAAVTISKDIVTLTKGGSVTGVNITSTSPISLMVLCQPPGSGPGVAPITKKKNHKTAIIVLIVILAIIILSVIGYVIYVKYYRDA